MNHTSNILVADQNIQSCTLVKSKPIKLIPVNTIFTVHTQSCLMTLLKANTLNLRAIKSESFMKGSRSAQRRMYTQRDQIRRRCPACAACTRTCALVHSRSHTHKHAVLCWCDKSWTFNGQDTGQTTPTHWTHCIFSWTAQFRDFGIFGFQKHPKWLKKFFQRLFIYNLPRFRLFFFSWFMERWN